MGSARRLVVARSAWLAQALPRQKATHPPAVLLMSLSSAMREVLVKLLKPRRGLSGSEALLSNRALRPDCLGLINHLSCDGNAFTSLCPACSARIVNSMHV